MCGCKEMTNISAFSERSHNVDTNTKHNTTKINEIIYVGKVTNFDTIIGENLNS